MTILEEAGRIVSESRQDLYGTPWENWTQTAELWSAILKHPISAEQAVACMIAVKIARELHAPKRDNRVDLAGYALVLDMVLEERQRRCNESSASSSATPLPISTDAALKK